MSEKTTVALIALSGVVFSGLLSFFVSQHQADLSVHNLSVELESKYNEKLYESRLDAYPKLYETVSNLGKDIRKISLPRSVLAERLQEIDLWDSQYAILLSPSSLELILNLRNILDGYTNFDPHYDSKEQVGRKNREVIFEASLRLEQALKKEIGVYDAKSYHQPNLSEAYPHSWKYISE